MPQGAEFELGEFFGATHVIAIPWGTQSDLTDVGKDGAVTYAKTQLFVCAAEGRRA